MEQSVMEKLVILADSAKYDAACTSSGSNRGPRAGGLGSCLAPGCCHTFTADGRCVSLLKVLMSNCCAFDCAYCVNRRSNDLPRATFTPRELADLTIEHVTADLSGVMQVYNGTYQLFPTSNEDVAGFTAE